MCLAIPYQVIKILDEDHCLIKVGSGSQQCFIGLVDEIKKKDWIVVHAGFAIEKISQEDAEENIKLLDSWRAGKNVSDTI